MNIIIKIQASKTEVNVIQAIVIRNLFLAFGCWIHMKKDGVSFIDIPRNLFKLVFLRGVFGFMSTMGLYIAIDYLPLSLAITVYYVQPIIVAIVCFLLLGERLGKLEILSIFSAMFGVILLTNPQLIFPSLALEASKNETHDGTQQSLVRSGFNYYFGIVMALWGSVSGSFVFVVCRKLGTQVHVSLHPFYMALICGFGGVWLLAFTRYTIGSLGTYDIIMLTMCGLCSWIQQEA